MAIFRPAPMLGGGVIGTLFGLFVGGIFLSSDLPAKHDVALMVGGIFFAVVALIAVLGAIRSRADIYDGGLFASAGFVFCLVMAGCMLTRAFG